MDDQLKRDTPVTWGELGDMIMTIGEQVSSDLVVTLQRPGKNQVELLSNTAQLKFCERLLSHLVDRGLRKNG